MKKREFTLPTLLGLLLAVGGLVSGLWLVQTQLRKESVASTEEAPKEIRVSNISESEVTVSWVTDKALPGFVQYGENGATVDLVVSDDRDQEKGSVDDYFTHYVTIKGLKSATTYKYKIGSGKSVFDQNGQPYMVTTAPTLSNQPTADVAYGSVITTSGEPAEGAIVYNQLPGGGLLSALVKASGSWVIPLSTGRTAVLDNYLTYDRATAREEISVQGGPLGNATAVVTTEDDSPVPAITLGGVFDFAAENGMSASDSAVMEETASKFSSSATETLLLLSPQTGEGVVSRRPEIVGKAPAGTKVTIEVHSDEIVTGTVVADENGEFQYDIPSNLSVGEHTVTITAVINGVTKAITKTFVVQAASDTGLPAYTATPSATLSPTTIPTKTTTPTPSPTIKLTPTPTPIVEATEPTETLPETGYMEWTWLMVGIGMALMLVGGVWYKRVD